jgi:DNA-binding winged helix-turn-helix (wHTH) protein/DNA polymerase III delta prime subunit
MLDEGDRPVYAWDDCEVDLARRELRILGSRIPIGGRAFELLEVLVRSAGQLVTKDQLMERIWPGAIVTENTLQVHASALRKALGPFRDLLRTEAGRGYRLLGDWSVRSRNEATASAAFQKLGGTGTLAETNLPAAITPLIGRSAAEQALQVALSAYRLVTLTGPGGIGKTALALEVARRIRGEFADGAWVVELGSLSNPTLVPATVAGVLGLGLGANSIVPESVAQIIGGRSVLLLLDNCEHLIGSVATLAETLLALCPNITILVTSREILRIQGEYVYRVPPLDVPSVDVTKSGAILEYSALRLFVTRIAEAGADLSWSSEHWSKVAEVCRHLDGIPLGIEFAAARAATLGIKQVAVGLRDRFESLASARRTALPRHRTLRATFDWSFELLTEAERDLLRRLAIFAGPFSLTAAALVELRNATSR